MKFARVVTYQPVFNAIHPLCLVYITLRVYESRMHEIKQLIINQIYLNRNNDLETGKEEYDEHILYLKRVILVEFLFSLKLGNLIMKTLLIF